MTNLAFDEFEVKAEITRLRRKTRPLFPVHEDYEERKRELQQINLSPWEYQEAIKAIAEEFDL